MSGKPTYEELEQRVRELEQTESKRNQVEDALRVSEGRYRLIAENTADVIWVLDPMNQTFKYASPSVYHLLGFTDKESINRSLAQTVTPASLEYIQRTTPIRIERMLQGDNRYYTDEIEVIHKDGHIVLTEINMHFVKNKFTGLIEGTGVMRDITERKRAEASLQEVMENYRTLSTNIPGMVYRAMPNWSVEIILNSEIICGYSINEFTTQKVIWLDLIHRDDKQQIFEEGAKLAKKQMAIVQEYRIIAKDGSTHWVSDHKASVFKDDGSFISIDGVVYDISKRKQAEEQRDKLITELQKALSEVKTLQGFLPICSYCKKIRDDKGYWNQIESYIHQHSDAEFSHGICPECAQEYYPDMDLYGD